MNSLNRDREDLKERLVLDIAAIVRNNYIDRIDALEQAVEIVNNFLKKIIQEAKAEEREEICNTKLEEPPEGVEGLSDKRQAFLAGQINMLMRIKFPDQAISAINNKK